MSAARAVLAPGAGAIGLALLLALVGGAPLAFAQGEGVEVETAEAEAEPRGPAVELEPGDGPVYTIGNFTLSYSRGLDQPEAPAPPSPELQSALAGLLPISVELGVSDTGFTAPRPGEPTRSVWIGAREASGHVRTFHASALGAISLALLEAVHERGLMGVYVQPSSRDIDLATERDLRAEGDEDLHFEVAVARIRDVRTIAAGDRIDSSWKVDNPAHRRIRLASPLQPKEARIAGTSDVLRRDVLERYLFRLNRHPGRYVEAALAASQDHRGASLDYRVFETRPWSAYAQVANTGTDRTEVWQSRFGYIHRQVTDRDDILNLQYVNGADAVHGISGYYEAPFFGRERPEWMETTGKETGLLRFIPRSKIPWWGIDGLRWRLAGGWTRTVSAEIPGLEIEATSENWDFGGELRYNALQYRNLFLDTFLSLRYRGVHSLDEASSNQTDATLFLTRVGIALERINGYSNLRAELSGEYGIGVETPDSRFDNGLGRSGRTDPRWKTVNWDVGISHYLEPLLWPSAWRDPATHYSSTLSHEIAIGSRGQYAFRNRLVPQVSQVIGGLYSVRGFSPGQASGDSVYIQSIEYRFHLPRSLPVQRRPVSLPWIGDFRVAPQQVYGRPDWDLVLRGFLDAGIAKRNRRADNQIGKEANHVLVGAGVGLELVFKGRFRVRADWARAIYADSSYSQTSAPTNEDLTDESGKFHFLFSAMY